MVNGNDLFNKDAVNQRIVAKSLTGVSREAYLAWDEDTRFLPILRFTLQERRFTRESSGSAIGPDVFMNNAG